MNRFVFIEDCELSLVKYDHEDDREPDLAIWIFKPYRSKGYGCKAFLLGLKYCFNELKLEKAWAGCYENNIASMRMLDKIGFVRDSSGDSTEIDAFDNTEIKQLSYVVTKEDVNLL